MVWISQYILEFPGGRQTGEITSTQKITFSSGSRLVASLAVSTTKTTNGDWWANLILRFVDPQAHGGGSILIDYQMDQRGFLYSSHCTAGNVIGGPFSRARIWASDQTVDYLIQPNNVPCPGPWSVTADAAWSGRSPTDLGNGVPLKLSSQWGYDYYSRGIISSTAVITLSYGYSPPPPPATPTPTPTPVPEPCWVCRPAGEAPIWWGINLSPRECYTLVPQFGWDEREIFGVTIPGVQLPEVQICVRWLSIEGEFLGLSYEVLIAAVAGLIAISLLLSILGGI